MKIELHLQYTYRGVLGCGTHLPLQISSVFVCSSSFAAVLFEPHGLISGKDHFLSSGTYVCIDKKIHVPGVELELQGQIWEGSLFTMSRKNCTSMQTLRSRYLLWTVQERPIP